MMYIFKFEFKKHIISTCIWALTVTALMFLFMSLFPAFASDQAIMDKILENYPEEMLKVLGMNAGLSLSSVLGYFAFVFVFIQLILAMHAGQHGFSVLSVEERELTADYLMTRPVSRLDILNAKILSSLSSLVILFLVTLGTSILSTQVFSDGKSFDQSLLIKLICFNLLFQLLFFSIGILISVLLRKIRNVLTFSLGLAFASYTINGIKAVVGGEILGYFSPFTYLEPSKFFVLGYMETKYLIISILIVTISIGVTYFLYPKRDIYSL